MYNTMKCSNVSRISVITFLNTSIKWLHTSMKICFQLWPARVQNSLKLNEKIIYLDIKVSDVFG